MKITKIQRYVPSIGGTGAMFCGMEKFDGGAYVRYEDVKEIIEEALNKMPLSCEGCMFTLPSRNFEPCYCCIRNATTDYYIPKD